ncbi:MAG: tRNA (adenosine(37)-N6)-dimethylallyltransferase MiaA [Rickettsiales bacterium]|nr:MAG: tRNA (adenosine(37)-N6)-dimethylallyltransferase MiaA [Rickettsiales bacterium]
MTNKIIVISGATASGKTAFAIDYALKNNGVVINADSRQIYKGLPILSAQPNTEEKKQVKHLLYDFFEPAERISVGKWLELVKIEIDKCFKNGELPIVCGGTGMYISRLIDGISPLPEVSAELREKTIKKYEELGYENFKEIALKIDKNFVEKLNLNDKQRLMRVVEIYELSGKTITELQMQGNELVYPSEYFKHINIRPPKEKVYENCRIRFEKMLEIGVLDEVLSFKKQYNTTTNTIGYNECLAFLDGNITKEELIYSVSKITRLYAKRQFTWFDHQFKTIDTLIPQQD